MDSPAESVLPPTKARSPMMFRVLGLTAGMVIAVTLYLVMHAPGGAMGVWSALTLPGELRGASFIAIEDSALGSVYTVRGLSFATEDRQGRLATLVIEDGRELAVRFSPAARYALQLNGNIMVDSDAFIDVPARAPAGLALAFSRPFATSTLQELKQLSTTGVVIAPSAWESVIYYPLLKRESVIGRGYAPLFISDTVLLLITASGIQQVDLQQGIVRSVLDRPLPSVVDAIKQSPDRTLIAFTDTSDQTTHVYRVADTGLQEVLAVAEAAPSYALGNEVLYVVRKLPTGTQVWRYGFSGGEPQLIHTLPAALAIGQIAL